MESFALLGPPRYSFASVFADKVYTCSIAKKVDAKSYSTHLILLIISLPLSFTPFSLIAFFLLHPPGTHGPHGIDPNWINYRRQSSERRRLYILPPATRQEQEGRCLNPLWHLLQPPNIDKGSYGQDR